MAIIGDSEQKREETKPTQGIIGGGTKIAGPPPPPIPGGKNKTGINWKKLTTLIIIAVGLVAAGLVYKFYTPGAGKPGPGVIDEQSLSLELDRVLRIGGLIALTEDKILNLENALRKAEELNDEVVINSIRLGLSKNLDALSVYQEDFIKKLTTVSSTYDQDSKVVNALLKIKAKESGDLYKTGNIKTIETIIALLTNRPENTSSEDYFRKEIKDK